MNSLIARLIAAHRLLSREIRRELRHRFPDHFRLAHLKKRRLAVKDQLHRHLPDAAGFRRSARAALGQLRGAQMTVTRS